jgi:hypothetical protein
VCSPEGGSLKDVSMRVFPNLRRTEEYRNLPSWNSVFIFSVLSHFIEKKYFHGNVGTY